MIIRTASAAFASYTALSARSCSSLSRTASRASRSARSAASLAARSLARASASASSLRRTDFSYCSLIAASICLALIDLNFLSTSRASRFSSGVIMGSPDALDSLRDLPSPPSLPPSLPPSSRPSLPLSLLPPSWPPSLSSSLRLPPLSTNLPSAAASLFARPALVDASFFKTSRLDPLDGPRSTPPDAPFRSLGAPSLEPLAPFADSAPASGAHPSARLVGRVADFFGGERGALSASVPATTPLGAAADATSSSTNFNSRLVSRLPI